MNEYILCRTCVAWQRDLEGNWSCTHPNPVGEDVNKTCSLWLCAKCGRGKSIKGWDGSEPLTITFEHVECWEGLT